MFYVYFLAYTMHVICWVVPKVISFFPAELTELDLLGYSLEASPNLPPSGYYLFQFFSRFKERKFYKGGIMLLLKRWQKVLGQSWKLLFGRSNNLI